MEKLGKYEMKGKMSNQDSGYSLCGYGTWNGREYFIKEFLAPKYPLNDTVSSPKLIEKKLQRCKKFEAQKTALYRVLDEYSDGNAVRVRDFFRVGTKYYMAMDKVKAMPWKTENIYTMDESFKRRICCIIAHSVHSIHQGGLIHADLKPTNILFSHGVNGELTAKLIDFDSSFLESDPPAVGSNIEGDQVYFSPEATRHMWGEEVPLTCKMDVFALGVLFHQYFCGELPDFDHEQADEPGDAAARGIPLSVSPAIPADVASILRVMLDANPAVRPTALEVSDFFRGGPVVQPVPAPEPEVVKPAQQPAAAANVFFRPGDL